MTCRYPCSMSESKLQQLLLALAQMMVHWATSGSLSALWRLHRCQVQFVKRCQHLIHFRGMYTHVQNWSIKFHIDPNVWKPSEAMGPSASEEFSERFWARFSGCSESFSDRCGSFLHCFRRISDCSRTTFGRLLSSFSNFNWPGLGPAVSPPSCPASPMANWNLKKNLETQTN